MSAPNHIQCDEAIVSNQTSQIAAKHPIGIFIATTLASSLAFVDGSVVNVGLSAIQKSLNADAAGLQWIVNAYLLPLSALLLLGGAAGDRLGRARLLVIGTTLFAAASIICALAPNLIWLLVGRGLQGCGAALLMPNSLAILGMSFTGAQRGRVIGIWASVGAMMAAIGPVLGGWLIDSFGWRAIFLINIPLAAAAVILAVAYVPSEPSEKDGRLDLLGGITISAALGLITWALTTGSGGAGWTVGAIGAMAAGIVLSFAFIFVEHRKGEEAMMPLSLFSSSQFIGITVLTFLLYGALGALLVLMPFVLIRAAAYSGTQAGTALLPFALVLALASPLIGSVAGRIGSRLPLTIGSLVVAAGFLLMLRIGVRGDYWSEVFPSIFVAALGMAGAVAPLTTAVLASVDRKHTGSASGLNSAVARTGGLVATALLGGVLGVTGADLIPAFHSAITACAFACLGAAIGSFCLISDN